MRRTHHRRRHHHHHHQHAHGCTHNKESFDDARDSYIAEAMFELFHRVFFPCLLLYLSPFFIIPMHAVSDTPLLGEIEIRDEVKDDK